MTGIQSKQSCGHHPAAATSHQTFTAVFASAVCRGQRSSVSSCRQRHLPFIQHVQRRTAGYLHVVVACQLLPVWLESLQWPLLCPLHSGLPRTLSGDQPPPSLCLSFIIRENKKMVRKSFSRNAFCCWLSVFSVHAAFHHVPQSLRMVGPFAAHQ